MKKNKVFILLQSILLIGIALLTLLFLSKKQAVNHTSATSYPHKLADSISKTISTHPGEIGVALIINNKDTVAVNNKPIYPMMSVFKIHQAIAVCNKFDGKGLSLDYLLIVNKADLDSKTWSPMLKDYTKPIIRIAVRDLLKYTLAQSDNNASNIMFEKLIGTEETDRYIAKLIPRSSFRIAYTESDMRMDYTKAYSNYTSPLGAAILFNRLFTDSLMSYNKQHYIQNILKKCVTGKDRIMAPLINEKGISIAHKSGSGYTNEHGILTAHNDVAHIILPNEVHYTLAVFIKDFKGTELQASQAIALVSNLVYHTIIKHYGN